MQVRWHLILLTALLPWPASAQNTDQTRQQANIAAGTAARDCILRVVERLEPSAERASDVATAAFGACDREVSAVRARGAVFASELLPRLEAEAVLRVVEMRAARRR